MCALSQRYIPNIQPIGYSSMNSVEISPLDEHEGAGILLWAGWVQTGIFPVSHKMWLWSCKAESPCLRAVPSWIIPLINILEKGKAAFMDYRAGGIRAGEKSWSSLTGQEKSREKRNAWKCVILLMAAWNCFYGCSWRDYQGIKSSKVAELLSSYKNAYKKCWNVEVPDVLGWFCGIFFPLPGAMSAS